MDLRRRQGNWCVVKQLMVIINKCNSKFRTSICFIGKLHLGQKKIQLLINLKLLAIYFELDTNVMSVASMESKLKLEIKSGGTKLIHCCSPSSSPPSKYIISDYIETLQRNCKPYVISFMRAVELINAHKVSEFKQFVFAILIID